MNVKKISLMSLVLFFINSYSVTAEPYIGLKAGKSWLEPNPCMEVDGCKQDDYQFGGILGYNFSPYIAIESNLNYLGEFKSFEDEHILYSISVSPKLSLPLNENVAIYSKVGASWSQFGSDTDLSYLGGVGIEFNRDKKIGLRLEYNKIFDNDFFNSDIHYASLSVIYKFSNDDKPIVKENLIQSPSKIIDREEKPQIAYFTNPGLTKNLRFSFDSDEISTFGYEQLNEIVNLLNTYPEAEVVIIGYTDSTGDKNYNFMLSKRRAQSVAKALDSLGIDESRISIEAKGELNPKANNNTREGRAKNRRVEILIDSFDYKRIEVK